jgi:hypothetical protein
VTDAKAIPFDGHRVESIKGKAATSQRPLCSSCGNGDVPPYRNDIWPWYLINVDGMADAASELLRTTPGAAPSPEDCFKDDSHYLPDVIFLVSFHLMATVKLTTRDIFQVEDTLFKVHRHYFEQESVVFRDMLQLPLPPGTIPDGCSDQKPLRLEGVDKGDFKQLLRVMYPR